MVAQQKHKAGDERLEAELPGYERRRRMFSVPLVRHDLARLDQSPYGAKLRVLTFRGSPARPRPEVEASQEQNTGAASEQLDGVGDVAEPELELEPEAGG